MSDPASGSTVEGMLNSILSECVWGSFPLDTEHHGNLLPHLWEMHSPEPRASPPVEGLISFGEFLENKTNLSRPERKNLKTTFTNDQCVGSSCREYFELLVKRMTLPCDDRHGDEFYKIMPAFFRFLSVLNERELDFKIIFRTFGRDIDSVVAEYNMFWNNMHPFFRCEKIGATRAVDMEHGRGVFSRSKDNAAELVMLSPQKSDVRLSTLVRMHINTNFAKVNHPNNERKFSGMLEIYNGIQSLLSGDTHALAIQDHFEWWNQCGET